MIDSARLGQCLQRNEFIDPLTCSIQTDTFWDTCVNNTCIYRADFEGFKVFSACYVY